MTPVVFIQLSTKGHQERNFSWYSLNMIEPRHIRRCVMRRWVHGVFTAPDMLRPPLSMEHREDASLLFIGIKYCFVILYHTYVCRECCAYAGTLYCISYLFNFSFPIYN